MSYIKASDIYDLIEMWTSEEQRLSVAYAQMFAPTSNNLIACYKAVQYPIGYNW